eukprot:TRINITY_DN8115_c0_g9_i1.p1 TRINITY_DN8115_c0_g9~~TRINITY_DN8115_c0_g9_i1.p1  ORF type:complete len:100 (+),score=6.60 TRINITY_DN8115_c0_g9_i1:422-721(+)
METLSMLLLLYTLRTSSALQPGLLFGLLEEHSDEERFSWTFRFLTAFGVLFFSFCCDSLSDLLVEQRRAVMMMEEVFWAEKVDGREMRDGDCILYYIKL